MIAFPRRQLSLSLPLVALAFACSATTPEGARAYVADAGPFDQAFSTASTVYATCDGALRTYQVEGTHILSRRSDSFLNVVSTLDWSPILGEMSCNLGFDLTYAGEGRGWDATVKGGAACLWKALEMEGQVDIESWSFSFAGADAPGEPLTGGFVDFSFVGLFMPGCTGEYQSGLTPTD